MKKTAPMNTNSGEIFGPPASESKNLIMPIAELGPLWPGTALGFSNFK